MENLKNIINHQTLEKIKVKLWFRLNNFDKNKTNYVFIGELLDEHHLTTKEKDDFTNFIWKQFLQRYTNKINSKYKLYLYLDKKNDHRYPNYEKIKIEQKTTLDSTDLTHNFKMKISGLHNKAEIPICITRFKITDIPSYITLLILHPTDQSQLNTQTVIGDSAYLSSFKAKNLKYEDKTDQKSAKNRWITDVKNELLF